MGIKKASIIILFFLFLCSCQSFQNKAEDRYNHLLDSLQTTASKTDKEEFVDNGLVYSNDTIYIRSFLIKWVTYSGEPSSYKIYYVLAKNWEGHIYELYKRDVWFEKNLNRYIDGILDSEKDKNRAEGMWSMAIAVGSKRK